MNRHNKKIEHLLTLIQENPTLEIVPMVDGDCDSADYNWVLASWGNAYIDHIFWKDGRVYTKSTDLEELEVDFYNNCGFNMTCEQAEKFAVKEVSKIVWEKVILIVIKPY